jgi:hypothetical protein
MVRFAAFLLVLCLCCACFVLASNIDKWTDGTTPMKVTATQISATPKFIDSSDRRANVMQFPKRLLIQMSKVEKMMPRWIEKNGPSKVKDDYEKLQKAFKEDRLEEAETAADAILRTMESEDRGG